MLEDGREASLYQILISHVALPTRCPPESRLLAELGAHREEDRYADAREEVVQEAVVVAIDAPVGVEVEARRVVLEPVVAEREVEGDVLVEEDVDAATQVEAHLEAIVERVVVVGIVVRELGRVGVEVSVGIRVGGEAAAVVLELCERQAAAEVEVEGDEGLAERGELAVPGGPRAPGL